MRHPTPIVSWLRLLVLALGVSGCALQDRSPPAGPAVPSLGEAWRAPLVLRPGPVAVNMQAPTRTGQSPGTAGEVFWLSVTALLTFGGSLLDLPNVVARHRTTVLDLPPDCADSWTQLMNRPQWLGPPEERMSALTVLAEAMREDLQRRGQALTIQIEPVAADDPRSAPALADAGARLASPMLAVADVLFGIEPQPRQCRMEMRVSVRMHLEAPAQGPQSPESVSLTRAHAVSVVQWAADPDVASRALQSLLGQIGRDIVGALPASPAR
ncbi:MAG: hypothetical protein QM722_12030 [Piscinibacter sp.]